MAELRMESHTARRNAPACKALLMLLALGFCLATAVRAQYIPEPTSGPALSAPTSRSGMPQAAAGQVISQIPAQGSPSTPAAATSPDSAKEMVVEVRIVGNKIPLEKITPFIRTRAGRPFDQDLVEEDVRRLDSSKMFVNVKTYFQKVPGGRTVIYEVMERPILIDVKFVGNSKVSKKKLQKEAGLKAGDPLDPFAVEEARRKLEEYYRTSGYNKSRVTLLEGDKPQDRNAIFLLNEGVKQKVQYVTFVGNSIASDARLRTQIHTRNPYVYLFKGELNRQDLDEDVERLTAYYRGLGFFRARIGREVHEYDINEHSAPELITSRALRTIDQFETVQWLVVTFIIDEGPRYKIGNVSVAGNTKYTSEELLTDLKLKSGDYFNQAKMTSDVTALQDRYGGVGYVFTDIKADPRFLEEPGTLDLVYKIKEGDRYTVGKIVAAIKGDYPHTKITTIMNRLSVHPGDIVDIREIRASERRLRASQLFENNPANGAAPKIVYSPPDKEMNEEDNPTQMARKPKSPPKYRGQSPDPNSGTWHAPQQNAAAPEGERTIDLVLEGTAVNPEEWKRLREEPPCTSNMTQNYPPRAQVTQNFPRQAAFQGTNQQSEMIVRGQYTPDSGRSTPDVFQRPLWGGTRPTAATTASVPAVGTDTTSASTPYSSTTPPPANAYQNGSPYPQQQYPQQQYPQQQYPQQQYPQQQYPQQQYPQQQYPQQQYPQQQYPQQQYPQQQYPQQQYPQQQYAQQQYAQQGAATATGQSYAPQAQSGQPYANQYTQPNNNQYYAPQPESIPPGPAVYSNQQPGQQSGPNPYNAAGAMPPPERIVEPIIPPYSPFGDLPPDPADPTRPLNMNIMTEETQTGRFMFGVGVTSDAGLTGQIKIDEQNFDLFRFPRSWDDIKNFTAWRGAGQRLVIEAYPGTQVQRYAVSFEEPYLMDSPVSMGISGYYFSRAYTEWFETRVGGRVALGYQFTHDLSGSIAYRGARVGISQIIDASIPDLAEAQGDNALHGFQISMAHNTRDNPFLATEGHLIQASVEQVIGTFQYTRAELDMRRHFTMYERPDGSGRHVLSLCGSGAITGDNTPVYDRYFAGGFSSIRGFAFRDASPKKAGLATPNGVVVGGDFQLLASAEYMFPITADDMLRGVVFCDSGTVEPTINDWSNRYRIAPGFGLRITVPAMGPAPLAFDFAFPVAWNPGDRFEVFSFFVGFGR